MKVMQRLELVISPSRPIAFLTCPTRTVPITGIAFCPTHISSSPTVSVHVSFKGPIEAVLAGFPECAFLDNAQAAPVIAVLQTAVSAVVEAAWGSAGSDSCLVARLSLSDPQGTPAGSTIRCPIAPNRRDAW